MFRPIKFINSRLASSIPQSINLSSNFRQVISVELTRPFTFGQRLSVYRPYYFDYTSAEQRPDLFHSSQKCFDQCDSALYRTSKFDYVDSTRIHSKTVPPYLDQVNCGSTILFLPSTFILTIFTRPTIQT